MLKPVKVKGWPARVNCVPEWPTKPAGGGVEPAVGPGVAVAFGAGVAGAVGLAVGFAVGLAVGCAVGLAVGLGVAVAVAVAVGETPLPTVNDVVSVVVALFVTIWAVMLCAPVVAAAAFHGFSLPAESVPTKSSGAEPSTCVGAPLMAGLSSQKLTLVPPLVGVRNKYALPPIWTPDSATAELRSDEREAIIVKDGLVAACATTGIKNAVTMPMRRTARGTRTCKDRVGEA